MQLSLLKFYKEHNKNLYQYLLSIYSICSCLIFCCSLIVFSCSLVIFICIYRCLAFGSRWRIVNSIFSIFIYNTWIIFYSLIFNHGVSIGLQNTLIHRRQIVVVEIGQFFTWTYQRSSRFISANPRQKYFQVTHSSVIIATCADIRTCCYFFSLVYLSVFLTWNKFNFFSSITSFA